MDKEKTNMYLLAIVAIVAIVGIVVLVLNAGVEEQVAVVDENGDIVGQALLSRMASAGCGHIARLCPGGSWQLDMDTGTCRCTPSVEAGAGGTAATASAEGMTCSDPSLCCPSATDCRMCRVGTDCPPS